MKKLLIILFQLAIIIQGFAQAPEQVLSNSGEHSEGTTMSLSWAFGESFVGFTDNVKPVILSQGYQRSYVAKINFSYEQPGCAGVDNGWIKANIIGGVPPYEFNWNTSDQVDSIGDLAAGEYTITVTDLNGFEFIESLNLEQPTDIARPEGQDIIVCFGEPVPGLTATATGDLNWYADGNLSEFLYNGTNLTTGETAIGTYSYYATQTINGCVSQSDTVSLSIVETPDQLSVNDVYVCFGDDIPDLYVDGNDINWYSDGELNNLEHNGNSFSTGQTAIGEYTYYVTQSNENCRSIADTVILSILAIPTIDMPDNASVCSNDSVQIGVEAEEGYSYTWTSNPLGYSTSISNPFVTPDVNNTYYVLSVNVSNSECESKDSVLITLHEAPDIDLGVDTAICLGSSVTISPATSPGDFESYIWNNSSIDWQQTVTETGYYSVTVTDVNDCQNSDDINVQVAEPYSSQEICLVTVNDAGYNQIVYNRTPDVGISSFKIWRESSTGGVYTLVSEWPSIQFGVVNDNSVNPYQYAYKYKITITDTCDNEVDIDLVDNFHRSILLQASTSSSEGNNLSWKEYVGKPIDTYQIYRGTDENNITQWVDNIPPSGDDETTYNDINAQAGVMYYKVFALFSDEYACDPFAKDTTYNSISSNILEYVPDYIRDHTLKINDLKIYPNPFNDKTIIEFKNPTHEKYDMIIRDLAGKIVETEYSITDCKIEITADKLVEGYYIIEIRGEKLYRGKLMVE